jgi:hypothetical protein
MTNGKKITYIHKDQEIEKKRKSDRRTVFVFIIIFLGFSCFQLGTAVNHGHAIFTQDNDVLVDWIFRCFGYAFPLIGILVGIIYLFITRGQKRR